jgi:type II secretory ATPase GspE/PulE/Tfp pilus assembly ATPase PilB-like protein
LTGHLLLSTLHTNDAATTFPRLIDMQVPPFLVASTVNIVMGQRLVRTVCTKCVVNRKLSAAELKSVAEIIPEVKDLDTKTFPQAQGCEECGRTGYQGRIGIREVLEVTPALRGLIMNRANADEIKEAAVKEGMTTMLEDGLRKVGEGITTLEEVLRIIRE